jgi:three-Cys-motif partner protein
MVNENDLYRGREQSRVKHEILRRYLESFAHVVGFQWPSITYIDGFSGPWNARSEQLSDTSFSIALNELRRARDTHRDLGRSLNIRCLFVEKDESAYRRLKEFADSVAGDVEVLTIPGEFESAIPEVIRFVKSGKDTFPFTLIDPTGSSGFRMDVIRPLLQLQPGEVLINFILEFIRRYIEQEGLRKGLRELFGTDEFDENLANLSGIDRDDAITEKYCECLGKFCGYPYVLRASVLHPDQDRLYFQLIYATRHIKGVEVFKKAEALAMSSQESYRAQVEEQRKSAGGQRSLLDPDEMPESRFYVGLRSRYRERAQRDVASCINASRQSEYDHLWIVALSYPMVWESDLREWLREWRDKGFVDWNGLAPRGRELIHGKGHSVSLKAGDLAL